MNESVTGTPANANPLLQNPELNMIVFDLNRNDSEALLRHTEVFKPNSGDVREDARLREALLELRAALLSHLEDPDAPASPEL